MIGFVYLWINNINGKKYVGLHKGTITDNYIGSGVAFVRAIEKYGIENFQRVILHEEYENEQKLYQKEFDIINQLNAVFSTEFYNMTNYDPKFVKFVDGKKEKLVTEETKKKMSKIAKSRAHSQETRRKMSESREGKRFKKVNGIIPRGKDNPQYGKKWYNNGSIDGTFYPGTQPEQWTLGRLRGKMFGEKNSFYGKKHSQETKEKIRNTKRKNNEDHQKNKNS